MQRICGTLVQVGRLHSHQPTKDNERLRENCMFLSQLRQPQQIILVFFFLVGAGGVIFITSMIFDICR